MTWRQADRQTYGYTHERTHNATQTDNRRTGKQPLGQWTDQIVLYQLSVPLLFSSFVCCFSFNRLDMPKYESYEKMYEKLTCAVEETLGFLVE